jgi:hypothetical protein
VPEDNINGDRNVEDVGNVEDVASIDGDPRNLGDEFGGILDPENYDDSLGHGFGDGDGMSFGYLGNTGTNKGRR